MNQRPADWGNLWHVREDNQPHPRTSLQQEARAQAQALEPLTVGQLCRVLKGLSDKANGPDAVSTQLLRSAPPLALAPLLQLFHTMEAQAEMQMHMVVMLPYHPHISPLAHLVQTPQTTS